MDEKILPVEELKNKGLDQYIDLEAYESKTDMRKNQIVRTVYTVPNLPAEEWKTIPDFPFYMVSNMGRIKRKRYEFWYQENHPKRQGRLVFYSEMLINQSIDGNGYCLVTLTRGTKKKRELERVNRLVAEAFIPNPDNLPVVNHINEIKTDNRAVNLEWCTYQHNSNCGTVKQRISKANTGKQFSYEHRKHLSESAMGNKNRQGHKNSEKHNQALKKAISKRVECGGQIFDSITAMADYYGECMSTVAGWLRGSHAIPQKYIDLNLQYYKEGN